MTGSLIQNLFQEYNMKVNEESLDSHIDLIFDDLTSSILDSPMTKPNMCEDIVCQKTRKAVNEDKLISEFIKTSMDILVAYIELHCSV